MCAPGFLLFRFPLLEQPLSLLRLVKCLDLGQQEPGEPLQICLGHPVLLRGGRCRLLIVFFSCKFSVAAPFCRAGPCCLAVVCLIVPGPWHAGGAVPGSVAVLPAGGAGCQAGMSAPAAALCALPRGRGTFPLAVRPAVPRTAPNAGANPGPSFCFATTACAGCGFRPAVCRWLLPSRIRFGNPAAAVPPAFPAHP